MSVSEWFPNRCKAVCSCMYLFSCGALLKLKKLKEANVDATSNIFLFFLVCILYVFVLTGYCTRFFSLF